MRSFGQGHLVKIDFKTMIENTQECFVQLWRKLERTRRLLTGQYKRFCIRNVLKAWFPADATDDFIWEICHLAAVDDEPQEGWNFPNSTPINVNKKKRNG